MAVAKQRVPTELEEVILRRIALGEDPWGVYTGGSRTVSQALARCQRLGWVVYGYGEGAEAMDADYRLTQAGRDLPCVKDCVPKKPADSSRPADAEEDKEKP